MIQCRVENIIIINIRQKFKKLLKKLSLIQGKINLNFKYKKQLNIRVIDVESLCLLSGKRVWSIIV